MKNLKFYFPLALFFVFGIINIALAHPGRTASDGCHYCRTNCDSWGVPWNQRHCHNSAPTLTPAPKPKPDIIIKTEPTPIINKEDNTSKFDLGEMVTEREQQPKRGVIGQASDFVKSFFSRIFRLYGRSENN